MTDDRPAVSWCLVGLCLAAWSGALVGFVIGLVLGRFL